MTLMTRYGSYLVCNEHIEEVKEFLAQFFEEKPDEYSFAGWVTFVVPGTDFKINLMKDSELALTKNMTFELYCDSLAELESIAAKHGKKIESFLSTESPQQYRYHYIDFSCLNICTVEVSYVEDLPDQVH